MVSIAAFQAVDPGSIPCRRSFVFELPFLYYVNFYRYLTADLIPLSFILKISANVSECTLEKLKIYIHVKSM